MVDAKMESIKNRAFDSAVDAVVFTDPADNVVYVNNAFLKMWECDEKCEILGKPVSELWKEKEEALTVLARLRIEKKWLGEITALKKGGGEFDARLAMNLVEGPDGPPMAVMAIFTDITTQKRLDQLHELTFRIAEEASSAQDLDNLYKKIHEIVKTVIPADNFYIALCDDKKGVIEFPYSVDEMDPEYIPIKCGKSRTGYVIETGKPQLISEERFEELRQKGILEHVGTPCKYWLGVPLKTTGRNTIGVLAVQIYKDGQQYTDEDKNTLVYASTQIAMAIQRRREEVRKEVMLNEIHHRVKNNFSFISSLLDMQSRRVKDRLAGEHLQVAQDRIYSMAVVHEELYRSKNLSDIDFGRYIKVLTDSLMRFHAANPDEIVLIINVKNVFFNIEKAIPCGLIINELFTNALKYAFPPDREGTGARENKIVIDSYRENGGKIVLRVKDNGVGLPGDLDVENTTSLGFKLVHLLARQIHGTYELDRGDGFGVTIKFEI